MSYAGFGAPGCTSNADCDGGTICCSGNCLDPGSDVCSPIYPPDYKPGQHLPGHLKCPPNAVFAVNTGKCSCLPGYTRVVSNESPWGNACLKQGQPHVPHLPQAPHVPHAEPASAGVGFSDNEIAIGIVALGVVYVAWSL